MNIVILGGTVGTIFKFRFELVEELLKKGYQVYILVQNEDEDAYLKELIDIGCKYVDVKISRRGLNIFKDLSLIFNYFLLLKKIKPNKVLTYTIKPNLYGGIVCRLLKIKYIATITGLGTSFQKENILSKVLKKLYSYSLKKAAVVFFQNETNYNYFINNKIVSVTQGVLVNGSGVNIRKFYEVDKIKNQNKIVFIYIGRIMKEKGINEYLEAAKEINKFEQRAIFEILGNYEEQNWREKIQNFESKGYIKYLGVSNDVRQEIRNSDILINPSYHEGLSNVLLEAGAMGKVLLGSNISGIKEAIHPLNRMLLFEVKSKDSLIEKINYILENKDFDKKKYVDLQKKYILKNYNRDVIVSLYIEYLEGY